MTPPAAWFEVAVDSPPVPDGVAIIMLAMPAVVVLGAPSALPVSGTFQLSEADAAGLRREDPFAALTLLLYEAGSARSVAFRPARSAVGPETQAAPPGMRRGWFQTDAFAHSGLVPRAGSYFVSAYLGALQSATHEVRVLKSL